jgi:hypothetical protein
MMRGMARGTFSLRFLLFWLVPYMAVAAAIWGLEVSPNPRRAFLSSETRFVLFAALTCAWLTAVGVVWTVRRH